MKQLKPMHLVCIEDEMRPNMALIQIKNGVAYATNANILVKIDLALTSTLSEQDLEILNGKYIHKEVWKEIWKCDILELEKDRIICHKDNIKKIFEYHTSQGEFFNLDSIVMDVSKNGVEAKQSIVYSHHLVTLIGKVFEEPNLHFSFSKHQQGTVVFPYDGSGMFAILMPVMNPTDTNPRYMF